MLRVAILANETVSLFELASAVELFALDRPEIDRWYRADVVSFSASAKRATANLILRCHTIKTLKNFDMLIIPSWSTLDSSVSNPLRDEVLRFHKEGKRILTFCSGSFLLAELGLLDDKSAMTHWRYASVFQQRYPQVQYVDNRLYVYDGQLGCSAGSAAGIDLGLEVIRQDFGYEVANQVARRLVVSAHRQGGQAQFVQTVVPKVPDQFAATLDWAIVNLNNGLDIDTLAIKANMSRRSFDRKFRTTMNMSPSQWLTQQRLNKAKALLEQETWPIEQVADMAGFESVVTLRHHFKQQVGISPKVYRQQFSGRRNL